MAEFYTRFIKETFGPDGVLQSCAYVYQENFNYAYDVLDALGELYPDRLAILWTAVFSMLAGGLVKLVINYEEIF